jgi:hypothetical protein
MDADRLAAFYAENARRWDLARSEFQRRAHGWRFGLAAEAGQWADSHAATSAAGPALSGPAGWVARLVEQADADGVIVKPEPGRVRSAYANRDSQTEMDTAVGFGFWPDDAEALIVHAGHAIAYEDLDPLMTRGDGAAIFEALRRVAESFTEVRVFSESARSARR